MPKLMALGKGKLPPEVYAPGGNYIKIEAW